ncbi:MAG: phosphopentomutase [Lachnospiraceae bacterium]|nr:phosphopentomutase [Lachnospiraceae bacterium]
MGKINRVIWIVLDSAGIGAAKDADKFDDEGTNTIGHVSEKNNGLNIPNMTKLGIGNIDGVVNLEKCEAPIGCYGRMAEKSNGKDTTIGHWEMMGIYSEKRFPTYPNGFNKEIIDRFIKEANLPGILGNKVASGTEILKELGDEHIKTHKPIIYTSADSVFQIACHEEVYPPEKLYEICKIARGILRGEDEVARVIARPFIGKNAVEGFTRTSNRRDFSKLPSEDNLMVYLKKSGIEVACVGKIEDIFAGVGVTKSVHTRDNMDGVDKTIDYMKEVDKGFIFTNLVEFDSKWGHRNDYVGYAKGLEVFDKRLPEIMDSMEDDDLLIIDADHGCDPTTKGTDHTRENVPLLVYGKQIKKNVNLHIRDTFADAGQTVAEIFGVKKLNIGESFLKEIL